jgi:PIN domain nuclease of toxin-antitoxin system
VLLLDTHAWIWSIEGDTRRVGRKAQALLSLAEGQERIRVSPVSIFEIVALHTSGRLRLSGPAEGWIRESLSAGGVRLAEMTPSIAIDAGAIPRSALADPLDRLLVATARQLDATFLTADQQILQYARDTLNMRAHDLTV